MYPGLWGRFSVQVETADPRDRCDPLTVPLRAEHPDSWNAREERVRWLLHNLTPGEKAKLYRALHDGENLRLDRCNDVIRKEKAALEKAAKKDVGP